MWWDVWVDDVGRPRSASIVVELTARFEGRDVAVSLAFDYRLSRFGKDITIEVPAPFRG